MTLINFPRPRAFRSEAHERAWRDKQRAAQERADQAWEKFPPGTVLHVSSARGLPRRSRGGVAFNAKASTEVEVVDMPEGPELVEAQKSKAVVSPLGAAAIAADDGLIVHGGPRSRAQRIAGDDELERLRAENAKLRAAAASAKRDTANPAAPARLARGSGGGKDAKESEGEADFGAPEKPEKK